MRITVIRVMIDGVVGYLTKDNPSMWDGPAAIVSQPLMAMDFSNDDMAVRRATLSLVVPGDQMYPKSGLRVDALPELVTFEVQVTQKTAKPARELQ